MNESNWLTSDDAIRDAQLGAFWNTPRHLHVGRDLVRQILAEGRLQDDLLTDEGMTVEEAGAGEAE